MEEWRAVRTARVTYLSYMDWGNVRLELKNSENVSFELKNSESVSFELKNSEKAMTEKVVTLETSRGEALTRVTVALHCGHAPRRRSWQRASVLSPRAQELSR